MAAAEFTAKSWTAIRKELDKNPTGYGLTQQVYGSLVLASFNIRKLGAVRKPRARTKSGRDDATMRWLADVCRHFRFPK